MRENGIPKYRQIEDDIIRKIHQEIYEPSSKLPSENQMAEYYQTSVPTVRKALGELVHQGKIRRVKGSGTYVCDIVETSAQADGTKTGFASDICFLAFTDYTDSSIMKMIRGAQSYLFTRGCNLSILCKQDDSVSESDLVETCHRNHVDGIIYFAESPYSSQESFELIKKYEIPSVMIDRGPENFPHTLVAAYHVDGGYKMTKYLLSLGHRRIAFVAETLQLVGEKERLRGYRMALKEEGIPLDEELIFIWEDSEQRQRLVESARRGKITAVQGVNDKIAAKIIQRMQKEELNVPQDLSVGGFDEWDEVKYVVPHVTTICQPFEQLGSVAAKKLMNILEGTEGHSQTYLPVKLVIKDSCCPPKAGLGEDGEK